MSNEQQKKKREYPNKLLKSIKFNNPPEVLLLGNGLNRLLELDSWEELVSEMSSDPNMVNNPSLDKFKGLSSLLQVYALEPKSKDFSEKIQKILKSIKNNFNNKISNADESTKQKIELYSKLCNLDFQSILTTNYDLFVEDFLKKKLAQTGIKVKVKREHGRKNVSSQKKRDSLYDFRYLQYNRNSKLEQLNEPYIWHIHGNQENPKNIMLDFYSYGTNLSILQSYGYHFIKKYMACVKKVVSNTNNESIEFQPESWLDYFFLGNIYIVGLGLDADEFELRWLLTYRKRIHNIISERLEQQCKPIFGNIYFMDIYSRKNDNDQDALDKVKRRSREFEILGCKYKNFGNNLIDNDYKTAYCSIITHLENRKTDDFDSLFEKI